MSRKSNPNQVISTAAYLLFYRRRSAGPLGPPELQNIVNSWRNPDSEAAGASEEESTSRNVSPSGNGLRLGGSSRNGSSSAFGAGTGAVVGALRGGGSDLAAGSHLRNGVAAENLDDDSPPGYVDDEGYADDDNYAANLEDVYAPLNGRFANDEPNWSFGSVDRNHGDDDSDVAALDEEDRDRMLEDFGDELDTVAQPNSSPAADVKHVLPIPVEDAELAEIHVKSD